MLLLHQTEANKETLQQQQQQQQHEQQQQQQQQQQKVMLAIQVMLHETEEAKEYLKEDK